MPFSGLKQILLLKGYLYENSVYNDSNVLQEQLIEFGFSDYANEISVVKALDEVDSLESEQVYLRKVNENIVNLIKENSCSSVDEFVQLAEELGNQEAMTVAEEIKQNVVIENDCEN